MSQLFFLSKEFIFAILLISGTIKMILPLVGIDALPDLTLMSAFAVTTIMILHMRETLYSISKEKVELIVLLTLFYLLMIFSLSYTSSQSSSLTKTINFGTMAMAFYFPLLVKSFNIEKFMHSVTSIIFIVSVIFLNFYTSYLDRDETVILALGEEKALQMTALYLTISWLNGILVLYYFFQKQNNAWMKWVPLLIAFAILISAGGRGPLIFTVLILGIYFIYQLLQSIFTFQLNRLTLPVLILIIIASATIFIVVNTNLTKGNPSLNLLNNTVERLVGLVNEDGGGASAHSRITNAKFSIEKINQNPFWGYGVGSYGYEMTKIDYLDYPHNIFLEIWFELGYIPLLIFLFLLYKIYQHIDPKYCAWCMALFFYFLLNVLKSSSLIDIRMMLGFYAIFITIENKKEKK